MPTRRADPGGGCDPLVLLLAGGQGERLFPLTRNRAKPAVSFGGPYRIIDFTLSNCLNSGLRRIFVLTQHKSLSLDRHIRAAWSMLRPELGEFVQTVPPQQRLVSRWYEGTADAVFQNLHLIEEERPRRILVLSGDHVYRMDYRALLAFHESTGAAATIACTRVPLAEATRMGVVAVDEEARVRSFREKPSDPAGLPEDPARALVNMGVYAFESGPLVRAVIADAKRDSAHDFGKDILPELVAAGEVVAYDVGRQAPPAMRYWQDVGTVDTYFETQQSLLPGNPELDLTDPDWPIHTQSVSQAPALVCDEGTSRGRVENTILSPGCVVRGGTVAHSILSPLARVGAGARVLDSILMAGATVGEGAELERVIIEEGVVVPPRARIGFDRELDRRRFAVTPGGIVVVPDRALVV